MPGQSVLVSGAGAVGLFATEAEGLDHLGVNDTAAAAAA